VDRRIFGVETEYGVTCTFRGQQRLSPEEAARYLLRRAVSWGRSSSVFLRNGGRLSLSGGSHPEYATPECDNVLDLVAHDKAGERILEGLLTDAGRRLPEQGIDGDLYLFKNNTDSAERLDAGRRRSVSTTSLACWLPRASTRPRAIATAATRSSKTGLVAMLRQLELPLAATIRGDERSLAILSVALGGLGGERVAQRGPGGYAEFGKDLVQVGSDRPM
jgi:hypothetical protein